MVLLRRIIGEALRTRRRSQDRTLRDVSAAANVSLGYLSEIERGHKEASSELLSSICEALEVPMSDVLDEVADEVAREESAPAQTHPVALLRPVSALEDRRGGPAESSEVTATAVAAPVSLDAVRARRARSANGSASPTAQAAVAA